MLVESMRDVGYTLETALADIMDNAIAAGAATIRILADTHGSQPRVAVLDDGRGMDHEELMEAMRLGSKGPPHVRGGDDLGRFGLGLKTASFSQCRRLTVLSRKDGEIATARWDLEQIAVADDWLVEIPESPMELPWADHLGPSGTLIIWERLDRLVDRTVADGANRHLVQRLNDAVQHLELVFHRFLAGERGLKRIAASINDRPLEPYDPFHASHSATIRGPLETIQIDGHRVTLQAFTLPHHKKVTPDEWNRYGGRDGYLRNQGFYVYRGKRLIIYGTWFGLARQTELTKLSRVRIDMPTGLDTSWKIDIKKASAQPPRHVRERLRSLIETIGITSKRIYTARGTPLATDSRLPVWRRVQDRNEIRYGLNQEHPVLVEFLDRLPDDLRNEFLKIGEMVGASLPMDALFADMSSEPNAVGGAAMTREALAHAVDATVRHLHDSGFGEDNILEMLRGIEPFRSNWALGEQLVRAAVLSERRDV
jgi:hypothetical protein